MKRLGAIVLLLGWSLWALAAVKSPTIVRIGGAKYYVHVVRPGETLYALAKTYEVDERTITAENPSAAEGLRAGMSLKIPVPQQADEKPVSERKLRKTFDSHYIAKGETLYAIARMYEIPIQTILEDNPAIDPVHLRIGERVLIRRKQIGSGDETETAQEWEAYRQSLSSVTDSGYVYHIVHAGETFYALSRRFGITEEQLGAMNDGLKPSDLKAGAMIKVPKEAPDDAQPAATDNSPRVEDLTFSPLRASEKLEVALLLPVAGRGDAANPNYLEFYQGFLLGLDSVRTRYGRSIDLHLYDTGRDSARIASIVADEDFRRARLIIGPVYEEELYPVIRYAEQHSVPVVSPLAHLTRMNSDALFQLAPDPARKWEKAAELVGAQRQVTLIYTDHTDREFEREMMALLDGRPVRRHTYRYAHPSTVGADNPANLSPLLENDEENTFIIMADNEVDVDRILAALASADTNISSRGRTAPRFTVLGNTRWNRYNNIDRTVFFKDRVVFVSTYHAKRDAEVVTSFDSAYIRAFGSLPTLYSYRGYDAAMIFCPAMYDDIQYDMQGRTYAPLQTLYRFETTPEQHNHVNTNWVRVNYNTDFTITIE